MADKADLQRQKHKKAVIWLVNLLIAAVASVLVVAMAYTLYAGSHIAAVHAPLVDATMKIRLEATSAHLWFEEIISGDTTESIDTVWKHLDNAEELARVMLEGGELPQGKIVPLNDPEMREHIVQVRRKLAVFRQITHERLKAISEAGAGTEVDQKYDATFRAFSAQADVVETELRQLIRRRLWAFRAVHGILITACILFTALVGVSFSRLLSRQIRDELKLRASNQQLDAANQELRANEQQLRANEQQLRAANQQLVANEQQLRAANQQLVSGEQQLRAANQQLTANEQQLRATNQQLVAAEAESRALAKFPGENPSPVLRIAKDGMVIYANAPGEKLLGAWRCGVGQYLPKERREFVIDLFDSGSSRETEFQYDGQIVSLTFAPVTDGGYVNVYGLDTTERRNAEDKTRRTHHFLDRVINGMYECLVVIDKDFTIRDVNDLFLEKYDGTREEVIGRKCYEVTHHLKTPCAGDDSDCPARGVFADGKSMEIRHRQLDRAGNEIIAEIHAFPLFDKEGEVDLVVELTHDITKRHRAEQALKTSEARYRELFSNMGNCVAVYEAVDNGADFVFTDFNRAGEKAEKLSREDILGKRVSELFPGVKEFGLFDVFQRVWKTGKPEHHPITLYEDDRITGWKDNYVYKLPSGEIVAVYDDVTEQKKAEEEIRNLAKFPAEDPNPVVRVSSEGDILYHNEAAAPLLEIWQCDEGTCLCLSSEWLKLLKKSLKSKRPKEAEIECGERTFSLTFAPVADAGYVNVYGLDVTERKRAEQALQTAHDELEQRVQERTAELAQSNEQLRGEIHKREQVEQRDLEHQTQLAHYSRLTTMGEMTSGLAHELNQPLCAISNYARGSQRIMKSGSWDNEELLDAMDGIAGQAERAGEIIRRIRELVRKKETHRTNMDVREVIAEAVALVQAEARLKGVQIHQLKSPKDISLVLADPIQIEQILVNFLRNAFDAMADIPKNKRRITIDVRMEKDSVAVAVSDTGIGVPPGIIHKIFEAFFTTRSEGLGMGLSISRTIIEAHGGRIKAMNNPTGGATFKFTLPAKGDSYGKV